MPGVHTGGSGSHTATSHLSFLSRPCIDTAGRFFIFPVLEGSFTSGDFRANLGLLAGLRGIVCRQIAGATFYCAGSDTGIGPRGSAAPTGFVVLGAIRK